MRAASLRNQMLIAMVVGIIFSHLIAISIYSGDRSDVITRTEAEDMVERIAGMVTLMSELDPAMRGMVARASETAAFQVSLTAEPDVRAQAQSHPLAVALEPYLRAHLPANPGVLIVVESERSSAWPGRLRSLLGGHLLRMLGLAGNDEAVVVHELRSSVRLTSGEWLNVDATLPIRQPHWAGIAGYYIILTAAVFLVLSAYMVVCATKPLKDFAEAANRLGTDLAATPLAETGPSEVVTATRAFNRMQHRLKRLIENRTQMLAAISHDLKTPITLLRLRAEMLETADVRARFIDTLDNMNAMIDSFLDFARQMSHQGPMRKVDISALVEVLCDDAREAGLPVECESDGDIICACRPDDIRRAIGNLVNNAIKYGKRAHVCVRGTYEAVEITVRDEGPGIPPDQLDRVCTPFYRGDASRNAEAGGVGLGLSTVKAILHGHGGELYLANLPDGGLLARATLPR